MDVAVLMVSNSVQDAVYPDHSAGSDYHHRKFCTHGDVVRATRKFTPAEKVEIP